MLTAGHIRATVIRVHCLFGVRTVSSRGSPSPLLSIHSYLVSCFDYKTDSVLCLGHHRTQGYRPFGFLFFPKTVQHFKNDDFTHFYHGIDIFAEEEKQL